MIILATNKFKSHLTTEPNLTKRYNHLVSRMEHIHNKNNFFHKVDIIFTLTALSLFVTNIIIDLIKYKTFTTKTSLALVLYWFIGNSIISGLGLYNKKAHKRSLTLYNDISKNILSENILVDTKKIIERTVTRRIRIPTGTWKIQSKTLNVTKTVTSTKVLLLLISKGYVANNISVRKHFIYPLLVFRFYGDRQTSSRLINLLCLDIDYYTRIMVNKPSVVESVIRKEYGDSFKIAKSTTQVKYIINGNEINKFLTELITKQEIN